MVISVVRRIYPKMTVKDESRIFEGYGARRYDHEEYLGVGLDSGCDANSSCLV